MNVSARKSNLTGLNDEDRYKLITLAKLTNAKKVTNKLIRDVCITMPDGTHRIVDHAYNFFMTNPHSSRREYFLYIARHKLAPMFTTHQLYEVMPFTAHVRQLARTKLYGTDSVNDVFSYEDIKKLSPFDNVFTHSYDLPRCVQALALAERDAVPDDAYIVRGLSKGARGKTTSNWLVLKRENTFYATYAPMYNTMGIKHGTVSDIALTAANYHEDFIDFCYDLLGYNNRFDYSALEFYVLYFDMLNELSRADRLYAYTLYSLHNAMVLNNFYDFFSMTTAQNWLRTVYNASPIAHTSVEGAGQYMKSLLTAQARHNNEFLGLTLVRERGHGNVWVWSIIRNESEGA